MAIASINPATGETLKTFDALSEAEIEEHLARAVTAFESYRASSFSDRRRWLASAADALERRASELARVITLEMGKPITASIAEVQKCTLACRYYVEHGESALSDESVRTKATRSFVRYQPLGVILAIMPWNFPFWQVFRFVAPALMAGNVGLLKHASNVPQCAILIEEIVREAGFPADVFQTLLIGSGQVGPILEDSRVAAATLTGSEAAGIDVATRAGRSLKKVVLELGGSDPFIVMPSADIARAAAVAVKARTVNNGQSCIAAKRFIVHEKVADEFLERFVGGMRALRVGDPLDEGTDIGPLSSEQIAKELEEQVSESVRRGARITTGGSRRSGSGNYFEPTILVDVPDDSPAARDELFGPVASVFRVSGIEEAIRIANATPFGLGSSAWTNDAEERERFINEIDAGQVFINAMVASDPSLPFGGVKRSGFGRELGVHGIREFVNVKTVWIDDHASSAKKTE
jgi:succinate-semialdehyde dehydrogenase/glutarate-semialdehyde dehydrogenase